MTPDREDRATKSFPLSPAPLLPTGRSDGGVTAAPDIYAPSCSVVVCTRHRPEQLDRCLAALSRLNYEPFHVVVVDNSPGDAETREVATRWGASHIVEPVVGLSRARNRGARACDTEVVAFLDDDSLAEPEWLTGLACEFEDPQVMAATGRTLPLSVETEAERLCASMGDTESARGEPVRWVVDRQHPFWFEMANFGGIGNGGNMAFRRSAFDVWPGFDERLGRGAPLPGGEEHHAFFSLIDRGYRVVYTSLAVTSHPYPRTMQDLRARHMRDLAAATAYITFMFTEQPRYRRALARYVYEALKGTPRTWRREVNTSHPRIVPGWRMLLARLAGPFLYARSIYTCPPSARGNGHPNNLLGRAAFNSEQRL